MEPVVSLNEVAGELDMISPEHQAFLNRQTGELRGAPTELLSSILEGDDEELFDWEVDVGKELREVLESPDWLKLPDRHSSESYRIMEQFCLEKCESPLQEKLLSAIQGRGAFRRFKDAVHWEGIQEAWYAFRDECLREEARDWLEAQGIAYRE